MELANLKSYQRTIASVDLPLKHFIETGFWNPHVIADYNFDSDIGDTFVRRACRAVARELKRPFIQCYPMFTTTEHYVTGEKSPNGYDLYGTRPLPEPKFQGAWVEMPKYKYLTPLAAPLFMLPEGSFGNHDKAGFQANLTTLWRFRINDRELWDKYYDFALNDPDCRKARRLTS